LFEIPKVVTSKLAEREANLLADAASHPEADLLTAFVERVLPERERSIVMKHLAVCAACREIIAFAQPEEATPGDVLISSRPRVSRGLFFRWGALAACAVLAVSVVLHNKQRSADVVAEKRVSEPMSAPSVSSETTLANVNKSAPAVAAEPRLGGRFAKQPATMPRKDADAAMGAYSRTKRPSVSSVHGPSPMNNNMGFIANNTVSNTVNNERNLQLNGRNVTQLVQLAPGVAGGAASEDKKLAQTSVADAAKQNETSLDQTEAAEVKVAQDKVAQKDDKGRADSGRALGNTSENDEVRAYASPAVVGGAITARALKQGEIRGQVVDPSNAVIADAKVTITNTTTGEKIVTATNSAGSYDVPSVPTGPYTVAVSKTGFQDFVRQDVNLESPTVAVDAKLQVGAVSEAVEVTAGAPTVETSSSTVASARKEKRLHASSARIENMSALAKARQAATWQITDAGDLQRSFDGGKNWESVSLGQPAKLRVVATAGLNVWAGGHGGALFHSSDGGNHFTQVTARAGQITLTGDIVTLDFPDAQRGRIETANHEVWTTSDGGKTWLASTPAK